MPSPTTFMGPYNCDSNDEGARVLRTVPGQAHRSRAQLPDTKSRRSDGLNRVSRVGREHDGSAMFIEPDCVDGGRSAL